MPALFILATGTELSTGRSKDTNSPYIANFLAERGYTIQGFATLPDDPLMLESYIVHAMLSGSDCVIMTGGLGPTEDDYTVDTICKIFNTIPVEDLPSLTKLEERIKVFKGRIELNLARRQIRYPDGAKILRNRIGLAPGHLIKGLIQNKECMLAAMPGVPQEMKAMLEEELYPLLLKEQKPLEKTRKQFYVYGVGESNFQVEVFGKTQSDPDSLIHKENLSLPEDFVWGITAGNWRVKVFLESMKTDFIDILYHKIQTLYKEKMLPDHAAMLLHQHLSNVNKTLSFAESCTGGLLGKQITDMAGSSKYFHGSIVSYANSVKMNLLCVSKEILENHGAVSSECAEAMALGAKRITGSDYALAITGIAGPDGGSDEKPVGTVWLGLADNHRTKTVKLFIPLDRDRIREYSASAALYVLYNFIMNHDYH